MKRLVLFVIAFALSTSAAAAHITFSFNASGFVNAGAQYPGLAGPVSGSISWAGNLGDPIGAITGVNFTLYGHNFTLANVGIANEGATQSAIGATVRGANAVVGDGAFTDFLLVFDRISGHVDAFAYSLAGRNGAIWWTPAQINSSITVSNGVPEPSSAVLLGAAVLVLGAWSRRQAKR